VIDGSGSLTSASDDLGRIVRPLDAEGRKSWTDLNVASLNAFKNIELASGVKFFHKSGSLACGTPPFVAKPAALLTEAGVPFEALASGDAVTARFPYLDVPATHAAAGGLLRTGTPLMLNLLLPLRASGGVWRTSTRPT